VVVSDDVPWEAVERVAGGAGKLIHEVSYVDEYRGSWVPEGHRSLTLRAGLRPTEATLTAEETGVIRNHVLAAFSQNWAPTCDNRLRVSDAKENRWPSGR
jgi:phenylalanyl-tRNA synthetase beta chain